MAAFSCSLGRRDVEILRFDGPVGEDRDDVVDDLHEAAVDVEPPLVVAAA